MWCNFESNLISCCHKTEMALSNYLAWTFREKYDVVELLKVMASQSSYLLFSPVNFPVLSKPRDERPCCLDETNIKDALLQTVTGLSWLWPSAGLSILRFLKGPCPASTCVGHLPAPWEGCKQEAAVLWRSIVFVCFLLFLHCSPRWKYRSKNGYNMGLSHIPSEKQTTPGHKQSTMLDSHREPTSDWHNKDVLQHWRPDVTPQTTD